MVTAMYITNYWLTLHLSGKRVVVAPGAELPAGVPVGETRALLASGAIRQADAGAMNRSTSPLRGSDAKQCFASPTTPEAAAPKPAKSKPKTEK